MHDPGLFEQLAHLYTQLLSRFILKQTGKGKLSHTRSRLGVSVKATRSSFAIPFITV